MVFTVIDLIDQNNRENKVHRVTSNRTILQNCQQNASKIIFEPNTRKSFRLTRVFCYELFVTYNFLNCQMGTYSVQRTAYSIQRHINWYWYSNVYVFVSALVFSYTSHEILTNVIRQTQITSSKSDLKTNYFRILN